VNLGRLVHKSGFDKTAILCTVKDEKEIIVSSAGLRRK